MKLPQLLNVLVGDMSLIGPRPLLPKDQPADPTVRLLVRPGITGWAQVNGARLLNAEQKDRFDEWYVRNASLLVDLRIIIMNLHLVLSGSRQVATEDTLARKKYTWPDVSVARGGLVVAEGGVDLLEAQYGSVAVAKGTGMRVDEGRARGTFGTRTTTVGEDRDRNFIEKQSPYLRVDERIPITLRLV